MKLHKGRWATYNDKDDPNNSNVDPVHSLAARMGQSLPPDREVNPSQWETDELKGEKTTVSLSNHRPIIFKNM
jgi:hypothetical protein